MFLIRISPTTSTCWLGGEEVREGEEERGGTVGVIVRSADDLVASVVSVGSSNGQKQVSSALHISRLLLYLPVADTKHLQISSCESEN